MNIGITSIQRDRGPYIIEWIAFHMVAGFNKFYIYNHGDDVLQKNILVKLSQKFPELIYPHQVASDVDRPQISAYQHSWATHKNDCDAMAFIDGDEFLFSPGKNFPEELSNFFKGSASALGVYWMIYGSSGHMVEPDGLIIDNFKRHAKLEFHPNRHVKTIMRGGEDASINHSHLFHTKRGTFDERNRLIDKPIMSEFEPSLEKFRLNHYTVQSYGYFLNKKKNSGQADLSRENIFARPDSWFETYDRNDCDDGAIYNYLIKTKIQMDELVEAIKT
jgi:hypothetical protein